MPKGSQITIQIVSRMAHVPAAAVLRQWVRAAIDDRCPPAPQITLRIVNRAEAQRLNRDFRGKDYATNVLTFVYCDKPAEADIVLCAQVVAREAREQGKSLAAHYAHLTIHGGLHAQGFDHRNARDAAVMEARETAILSKLGFTNPYQVSA